MSDDIGDASEDLVTAICEKMFFRDFVVRNPTFKKSGGQEKEAADVLVLDNRTLLAIQVKSKELLDPESNVEVGRLAKAIDTGVGQLKTLARALDAKQLTHVVTLRGIEIALDLVSAPSVVGVVLLDIRNEESLAESLKPSIGAGLAYMRDVPAHIFLRSTFELLASEFDTLPDFLHYLDCRRRLIERGVLTHIVHEHDFLALFKTKQDLVQDALAGKCDLLVVAPGTWDDYQSQGIDHRAKRDIANQPSYLVDGVIDYLHTALNGDPRDESLPVPTEEAYFAILSELGRLPRLQRRVLGEKIAEKLASARSKGFAFSVVADPAESKAVFFLASNRQRSERITALQNMTRAAAHRTGVRNIVGIGTEPDGVEERTFDVVLYRDGEATANDVELLEEMATTLFGPIKPYSRQEWE